MSDYISREDALECVTYDVEYTTEQIKGLPSADVVPVVHGRWIPYRCDMYECSVCQRIHTSFDNEECDANFCPNCGAKMDGGKLDG